LSTEDHRVNSIANRRRKVFPRVDDVDRNFPPPAAHIEILPKDFVGLIWHKWKSVVATAVFVNESFI